MCILLSIDFQKRTLASQSGEFNLKCPVFCELFPELAESVRTQLVQRSRELMAASSVSAVSNSHLLSAGGGPGAAEAAADIGIGAGQLNGILSNVIVMLCFIAFAWSVRYVFLSLKD